MGSGVMELSAGKLKLDGRGSISVFLVVVFACFITVTAVLFVGAKAAAGRSMADASLQLAGRSVLSEYDKRLLSDYGLFAFRGDEGRIEDSVAYYAEASLAPKDILYAAYRGGGARVISQNTRCEGVTADLAGFSLFDVDNFEDEIRTAAVPQFFESLLANSAGTGSTGGSAKGATGPEDGYGRVLRNNGVILSLPSAGFAGPPFPSFGDLSDIPKIEDVAQEGTALFAVSEYALSVFGNHVDGAKTDHFFGNEVEYLIAGKHDDDANYRNIKERLTAIRFLMNNIALFSDSEKMGRIEVIALAAAAVSGESAYEVVKDGVVEAWVAAETGNDLMLLEKGFNAALIKSPSQWATQNIVEIWDGWTSTSPAYAANRDGQSYRDYLRLMLFALDRETKLLRMMDLMQLNLKGSYYGDFLMREHYVGFRFECSVDGERYAYTERY